MTSLRTCGCPSSELHGSMVSFGAQIRLGNVTHPPSLPEDAGGGVMGGHGTGGGLGTGSEDIKRQWFLDVPRLDIQPS